MNLKLSLTASLIIGQVKEVQHQSKQDFFSIKHSSRRLKSSKFLQKQETTIKNDSFSWSSSQYKIVQKLANLDVKQLHYTLAQTQDTDMTLQFKQKQPKKKRLPSKIYNCSSSNSSSPKKQGSIASSSQNASELNDSFAFNQQNKIEQFNNRQKQVNDTSNKFTKKLTFSKIDQKQANLQNSDKIVIKRKLKSLFEEQIHLTTQQQIPDMNIHDFHIVKQIGQGTYSKVYMTSHKKTGFICALKVLQKNLIRDKQVELNAIRQIKILSCLSSHPMITTLYGSFYDQKCIYLILQYCTDGNLYQKLKKPQSIQHSLCPKNLWTQQKQDMPQKVNILKQICVGLKQLHQHSIMHRDIKPQNILCTFGGSIKLSDFGWSVFSPSSVMQSTLCGTPLYLAPEFITNSKYNNSIDIWALGVMAYQIFVGDLPFSIRTANDLKKIVEDDINFQNVSCIIARDFCYKTLRKHPNQRADIWKLLEHQIFVKYFKAE